MPSFGYDPYNQTQMGPVRMPPGGSAQWLEEQRRARQQQRAAPPPSRVAPQGTVGPTDPTPPIGPAATAPVDSAPANDNAFYDAALARRARALSATAQGQRDTGMMGLGSRGLDYSPAAVNNLYQGINMQEGLGLQEASSDIYGQQFASQQQRESEARAYQRQKETQAQDFQNQIDLMKIQKKLSEKKKSGLSRLLGGLGGAAAGFLTGGPLGAVAGGAAGAFGD